MRSTPAQDKRLRERLQEAVDHFAGGSADLFGRKIGYANGGYIRELLSGPKPVRTAIIERTHATKGMEGWFDAVLAVVPMQAPQRLDAQTEPLFEDASLVERFHALSERQKGAVEAEFARALERAEAGRAPLGWRTDAATFERAGGAAKLQQMLHQMMELRDHPEARDQAVGYVLQWLGVAPTLPAPDMPGIAAVDAVRRTAAPPRTVR